MTKAILCSGCEKQLMIYAVVLLIGCSPAAAQENGRDGDMDAVVRMLKLNPDNCPENLTAKKALPDMDGHTVYVILENTGSEDIPVFDCHIVIREDATGKIIYSFYEKGAWGSDTVAVKSIVIDTAHYMTSKGQRAFGVRVTTVDNSRAARSSETTISLFAPLDGKLIRISNKFPIPEFHRDRERLAQNRKYVAWFFPSKVTDVYGVMFNMFPKDADEYPSIYGMELNLCPILLFAPVMLATYSMVPELHEPIDYCIPDIIEYDEFKKVFGLQAGPFNMESSVIYGLDINIGGSFESIVDGASVSAIMNKHYIINGLTVAVIANHDIRCRGLQVAFINTCRDLRGFQFGLWNKNQKRSLPLINWCFSAKKGKKKD
ncbi:MAG: hypothetical protein LBL24_02585 [Bacteroidales bacterium]|jgi:hypothetical protein|nr:hypothetical protein [Bacteroidales bacterium]